MAGRQGHIEGGLWLSIETRDARGKRSYANSFVTDLPVIADTVAEHAACARSKVENSKFKRVQ